MLSHRNLFEVGVDSYPEVPDRIKESWKELHKRELVPLCHKVTLQANQLRGEELTLVHSEKHVATVDRTFGMSVDQLREMSRKFSDVYFSNDSKDCARIACAGAIAICEAVWTDMVLNGVAIIRPPGHHAEHDRPMGFCLFNNVAVAASVMQTRHNVQRILIVDWDIHHGNGTQKRFYDDPNVMYISLHRYDGGKFFPFMWSSDMNHVGGKGAEGRNMNIPWPCKGMGDAEYIHAFTKLVMPVAMEFNPELVIVSAGFDAATGDPIGGCNVTPAGFAQLAQMLKGLAKGRVAVCLEGGYNIDSVSQSVAAVTTVLMGFPYEPVDVRQGPREECVETVQKVAAIHSKYWRCLRPEVSKAEDTALTIPLRELLSDYRKATLPQKYPLDRVELEGSLLEGKFAGQVHVSRNWATHTGFLFVFVHPSWDEVRATLHPMRNTLNLQESYIHDASSTYIRDILSHNQALIDVDVDTAAMNEVRPSQYATRGYDAEYAVRAAVKEVWDRWVSPSNASRVFFIGAGVGASAGAALVAARADFTDRVEGIVNIVPATEAPLVHRTYADWYYQHSCVYVLSDLPRDKRVPDVYENAGNCRSAGTTNSVVSTLMHTLKPSVFKYLAQRLTKLYIAQQKESRGETESPVSAESEEVVRRRARDVEVDVEQPDAIPDAFDETMEELSDAESTLPHLQDVQVNGVESEVAETGEGVAYTVEEPDDDDDRDAQVGEEEEEGTEDDYEPLAKFTHATASLLQRSLSSDSDPIPGAGLVGANTEMEMEGGWDSDSEPPRRRVVKKRRLVESEESESGDGEEWGEGEKGVEVVVQRK